MNVGYDQQRVKKTSPLSFRFDETTLFRIKVLAKYYGHNSTHILEELIDTEYEKLLKTDTSELKKTEKFIKNIY